MAYFDCDTNYTPVMSTIYAIFKNENAGSILRVGNIPEVNFLERRDNYCNVSIIGMTSLNGKGIYEDKINALSCIT